MKFKYTNKETFKTVGKIRATENSLRGIIDTDDKTRKQAMNDIQINLPYDQEELEAWLDSQPPLSDDDINAMSAYFRSDDFQYTSNSLCGIIDTDEQTRK